MTETTPTRTKLTPKTAAPASATPASPAPSARTDEDRARTVATEQALYEARTRATPGIGADKFESGAFMNGRPIEESKVEEAADEATKAVKKAKKEAPKTVAEEDADDVEGALPETEADDDEASDDSAEDDEVSEEQKKPKKSFKQRVNELTRDKYAAVRRAEAAEAATIALERRLEALERGEKPAKSGAGDTKQTAATPERPNPQDFEYGELDSGYIEAVADYKADLKIAKLREEMDASRQQEAAAADAAKLQQKFDAVTARGHEKYDDFEEVVEAASRALDTPLSRDFTLMLIDSKVGEDIAYHLASNFKEARRIAKLSPAQQGAEFARLEARFLTDTSAEPDEEVEEAKPKQAPKPVKPSKAPEPVKTVSRGSGGKFGTRTDTDDFSSLEEAFKSGKLR